MAAPPPPTSKTAQKSDAGSNCPYCRFAFKEGVDIVECGVCSARHHQDCWADNGGCAVMGCAAAPVAGVAAPTARGPAPTATIAAAAPVTAAPAPAAPPAPARRGGSRPLLFGLLATVAVAGIVVATLAASGTFSKSADRDSGPSSPPPPSRPATPPPPPPPPSGPDHTGGVLASVGGTCGKNGTGGDCFLSLRSGPSSKTAEKGRLDNGAQVRVICQLHGESAHSSALGGSSDVWARTKDGLYVANAYLRGDGLDPYSITLPAC
jgi:hypothetical protein